ncbi:unnamed protein product [Vitrella brassicaformis CCMP3155]|uniref:Uncharacterized protein n=1 Tax=Vitrella brassicaformis (strain CCMP3155) TaxID=1169540 RepID=A0A0G4EZZ3_VITBC|nr:unnamed protein product [Vitrella brassicaformis CCMP3155]|eukprot:CEM04827.1 unnamed protein product [Vitrella brassicaformis CCMP3155]
MEEGNWVEIGEVIELGGQYGYCELPVILTADDINTHANKTAYGSLPRVLTQLMVVGRHVAFGDGKRLQIFRHANGEVRAIEDEPGFRLTIDPPLAHGDYLYQQHRLQHDTPVQSSIDFYDEVPWSPTIDASLSSFAKRMIIDHFKQTHPRTHRGYWGYEQHTELDKRVGGSRLDTLLTQSPHTPVAGCSTTYSSRGYMRYLVLTNGSHPFVAWIILEDELIDDNVWVTVKATEAPACGTAAFKIRFPLTSALARVMLGAGVAPHVFDDPADYPHTDYDHF